MPWPGEHGLRRAGPAAPGRHRGAGARGSQRHSGAGPGQAQRGGLGRAARRSPTPGARLPDPHGRQREAHPARLRRWQLLRHPHTAPTPASNLHRKRQIRVPWRAGIFHRHPEQSVSQFGISLLTFHGIISWRVWIPGTGKESAESSRIQPGRHEPSQEHVSCILRLGVST